MFFKILTEYSQHFGMFSFLVKSIQYEILRRSTVESLVSNSQHTDLLILPHFFNVFISMDDTAVPFTQS
jgi:hypothetical protein